MQRVLELMLMSDTMECCCRSHLDGTNKAGRI